MIAAAASALRYPVFAMVNRILPVITVVCVALSLAAPALAQSPAAAASAGRGRTLFETRCATCHGLDGHGGQAPAIGPGSNAAAATDDRIRTVIRDGSPAGMPAQKGSLSAADIEARVQHVRQLQRVGAGAGAGDAASVATGDAVAGRELFFGKANCAQCHFAEGRGGFLGTDLARTRLNADAIRQAIVNPDATPTAKNALTVLTRRDGSRVTGIVRNEDNFSIQLQDDTGAFHSVDKAAITNVSRQPAPLMRDAAKALAPADIDNLVRYVTQLAVANRQPNQRQ
jgi:putative heme-binding domain-containing protein